MLVESYLKFLSVMINLRFYELDLKFTIIFTLYKCDYYIKKAIKKQRLVFKLVILRNFYT